MESALCANLMSRKVEAAPCTVELDFLGFTNTLLVTLVHEGEDGRSEYDVYHGEDVQEALDAFAHPFARKDVPDLFKEL